MPLDKEHQIIDNEIKGLLELIPVISDIERNIIENSTNLAYMANLTFVTRRSVDILDQLKKRLEAVELQAARHASLTMAVAKMKNYKGEFCTISPNPHFYVPFPNSPDKDGYYDFVKQLGPDEVRPHYKVICERVVEAMQNGGQVPYGLTGKINSTPQLRVTMRKDK